MIPRRRLPRVTLVVLVALLAAGCQVRTAVTVDVAADGSGTVEVAVGLDADAIGRLPDLDDDGTSTVTDLAALIRRDDLAAAGWEVADPARGDDGMTWIRATKPFGTPAEADQILTELTGSEGPLRDLEVSRDPGFGRTSYGFRGTADLSGGLEAFGDEGLAAALDGAVLGQDTAAIEQELGQPLAAMFTLKISADLPGSVVGNGPGSPDDPSAVWAPRLGDGPLEMQADSTVYDWPVLGLTALAVASAVALVGLIVLRWVRGQPPPRPTDRPKSPAPAETN